MSAQPVYSARFTVDDNFADDIIHVAGYTWGAHHAQPIVIQTATAVRQQGVHPDAPLLLDGIVGKLLGIDEELRRHEQWAIDSTAGGRYFALSFSQHCKGEFISLVPLLGALCAKPELRDELFERIRCQANSSHVSFNAKPASVMHRFSMLWLAEAELA